MEESILIVVLTVILLGLGYFVGIFSSSYASKSNKELINNLMEVYKKDLNNPEEPTIPQEYE